MTHLGQIADGDTVTLWGWEYEVDLSRGGRCWPNLTPSEYTIKLRRAENGPMPKTPPPEPEKACETPETSRCKIVEQVSDAGQDLVRLQLLADRYGWDTVHDAQRYLFEDPTKACGCRQDGGYANKPLICQDAIDVAGKMAAPIWEWWARSVDTDYLTPATKDDPRPSWMADMDKARSAPYPVPEDHVSREPEKVKNLSDVVHFYSTILYACEHGQDEPDYLTTRIVGPYSEGE